MPEGDVQGRILLLGPSGQVGFEIERLARARGLPLETMTHQQIDIAQRLSVQTAIGRGIELVINAAAYTAVDQAETEEGRALAVNRDGPAFLAERCHEVGAALIHLSTDYVFDGTKGAPYVESDPIAPLCVYGRSKAAGEEAVRRACARHVILRTSWVFGVRGANFVKSMLRLGGERGTVSVVADQFGCPTPAVALAAAVLAVAGKLNLQPWGTFHCAGSERTTWFDFARAVFAAQNALARTPVPEVEPIATESFPTAARRPVDSTLDSSAFQARFDQAPIDWRQGMTDVLRELQAGEQISSAGRA